MKKYALIVVPSKEKKFYNDLLPYFRFREISVEILPACDGIFSFLRTKNNIKKHVMKFIDSHEGSELTIIFADKFCAFDDVIEGREDKVRSLVFVDPVLPFTHSSIEIRRFILSTELVEWNNKKTTAFNTADFRRDVVQFGKFVSGII